MTCYNPKLVKLEDFQKIDEKTGEIYKSRRIIFTKNDDPLKYRIIPCGKCEGCRIDKANDWATRCYLESLNHKKNCFLTLTYNNQNLKKRSLSIRDYQLFFKKLRKKIGKFSYLICGEYGPRTLRPHMHCAIFGWIPEDLKPYKQNHCGDWLYTSKSLEGIWGKGYIIIGHLTYKSAAYIARYVVKKAFGADQIPIKSSKTPEFTRASKKPAISLWAYQNKAKWAEIKRNNGVLVNENGIVKLKKIPQYLKNKWKEENREEYFKNQDKNWEEQINQTKKLLEKTDLNYWNYFKQQRETNKIKYSKLRRNQIEFDKLEKNMQQ